MADLVWTDHGGILVAEEHADERAIAHAVKQHDPTLFLEKHRLVDGRDVYTVQQFVGENAPGSPYRTVFYWDDNQGNPLPLTWRILDRLQELDGAPVVSLEQRMRERQEKNAAELRDQATDIAADMEHRLSPGHSAVLPRGVGLRMARDKRRAQGERC